MLQIVKYLNLLTDTNIMQVFVYNDVKTKNIRD